MTKITNKNRKKRQIPKPTIDQFPKRLPNVKINRRIKLLLADYYVVIHHILKPPERQKRIL